MITHCAGAQNLLLNQASLVGIKIFSTLLEQMSFSFLSFRLKVVAQPRRWGEARRHHFFSSSDAEKSISAVVGVVVDVGVYVVGVDVVAVFVVAVSVVSWTNFLWNLSQWWRRWLQRQWQPHHVRFSAVICHHGFKSKGWLQHCYLGTEVDQSKKSKPNQTFQAIMMFLNIFKIGVKIIEKDTSSTKPRQANGQFKICMPNGNGTSWHGC